MKFNLTESEHLQNRNFLNFDWLVRGEPALGEKAPRKGRGGRGKKRKKTYQKTMEEAKKSRFVEINTSGFPKMRGKDKFEKGGTGMENGWGSKMAHTQAHEKNRKNFSKFFLWRISLSTLF